MSGKKRLMAMTLSFLTLSSSACLCSCSSPGEQEGVPYLEMVDLLYFNGRSSLSGVEFLWSGIDEGTVTYHFDRGSANIPKIVRDFETSTKGTNVWQPVGETSKDVCLWANVDFVLRVEGHIMAYGFVNITSVLVADGGSEDYLDTYSFIPTLAAGGHFPKYWGRYQEVDEDYVMGRIEEWRETLSITGDEDNA